MSLATVAQLALLLAIVLALTPPLGAYMARVFAGERTVLSPLLAGPERLLLRGMRIRRRADGAPIDQDWKAYARSVLWFSLASWLALYALLRLQGVLPGNPTDLGPAPWDVTFNTTSSFVTNTNWQYYAGETTLSYVAQMTGLAVQNFASAAVGLAVAIAVIRGLAHRRAGDAPDDGRAVGLGNFWVDLVRACLYVLLPLSLLAALVLVGQGVLQTLGGPVTATTLTGAEQVIARGPVASQEAIKLLGTNGGGFFNVNSAMPFENPTGLSNLVQMVLVLLLPAALTATYGRMVGNRRQGWTLLGAMTAMFLVLVVVATLAEQHGSPAQHLAGLSTAASDGSSGGNLVGKEQRFGAAGSALFNTVTTVTSTGAVNAGLESFTGLGSLVPMIGLATGEVIFGGVGSGLYGMLTFVLLAVFIGGLMVGRTPELLGKKVEAREIKLAMLGALYMPFAVLVTTALAVGTRWGRVSNVAGGPQGFSESFYASLSQGNNNGSAFAGYTGFVQPNGTNEGAFGITFADLLGGGSMLVVRFFPIVVLLAIAGSMARKRAPVGVGGSGPAISSGTLRTDSPTFALLLVAVIVLVGALTFLPAFLLGPVVQSLTTELF